MVEKILGRASAGRPANAGDVLLAKIDLFIPVEQVPATVLDKLTDFTELFPEHGLRVWDPSRVVFCFDHFFQGPHSGDSGIEHSKVLRFANEQGIPSENIYDVGRHGISHQVPVENGWVLPGSVSIAADTQAATMGAMNCFSTAALYGTVPMLLTGDMWMIVPEAIRINLHGQLRHGVLGKDIALLILKDLGDKIGGRVVEFGGEGVASLSIDARMGAANGATHWGALAAIFPADQRLLDYVTPRARGPFEPVGADDDAPYAATYDYDLGALDCLVSGPHEIGLVRSVQDVAGIEITSANIGSCSSGRLEDLRQAAEVLRGRKIHPRVRMAVTPISTETLLDAAKEGLIEVFLEAGAAVTTPGCGACWFGNNSILPLDEHDRCISSSVENLRGRMGSPDAEIYLANPAVVAASALEGCIANPARYLNTRSDLRAKSHRRFFN